MRERSSVRSAISESNTLFGIPSAYFSQIDVSLSSRAARRRRSWSLNFFFRQYGRQRRIRFSPRSQRSTGGGSRQLCPAFLVICTWRRNCRTFFLFRTYEAGTCAAFRISPHHHRGSALTAYYSGERDFVTWWKLFTFRNVVRFLTGSYRIPHLLRNDRLMLSFVNRIILTFMRVLDDLTVLDSLYDFSCAATLSCRGKADFFRNMIYRRPRPQLAALVACIFGAW